MSVEKAIEELVTRILDEALSQGWYTPITGGFIDDSNRDALNATRMAITLAVSKGIDKLISEHPELSEAQLVSFIEGWGPKEILSEAGVVQ